MTKLELVSCNECNGNNNYYVVRDPSAERDFVAMHVVNGKFALYDYEFHDVISKFERWSPNNGYACSVLKQEHVEALPGILELGYEVNKIIYMHTLIKDYCLKQPKENEKHVLHHVNEKRRDNRRDNLIWVSRNQQRALLKKIGKLAKPPVEIRPIMPYLPKFCRWINAKKAFWISDHPANFVAVENKEQKHKYIESMKGKKHTVQRKFEDFLEKYNALMANPFGGQESFPAYLRFQEHLEYTYREIVLKASNVAISNCMVGGDAPLSGPDAEEANESEISTTEDVDEDPASDEDGC